MHPRRLHLSTYLLFDNYTFNPPRPSFARSWFRYLANPDSPLPPHLRSCVTLQFVLSRETESQELAAEQVGCKSCGLQPKTAAVL